MTECSECGKKLGILEGYRHPAEGWKKFVCNNCWYRLESSEMRYTSFILNHINKTGIGSICFVLIKIAPKLEKEAYGKLSDLPEIIELHPLFGSYDCIAKIKAENSDKLGNFIVSNIRTIDGITSTKTLTGTFSLTGKKY
jgi:DNA-binding Lrp family transcriptional regulator